MNFSKLFKNAEWISAKNADVCPVIRKNFTLDALPETAQITILGFGSFTCFINGKRVSDEWFLPFSSDFEPRNRPKGEELAYISYPCRYDITSLLQKGKNTLSVFVGNGCYTSTHWGEKPYGSKKLCYCIDIKDENGEHTVVSDLSDRYRASFVTFSDLHKGEEHDYSDWDDAVLLPEYDDIEWETVISAIAPKTEYALSDCPADKIVQKITPKLIYSDENRAIYDAGENLTGFPVIESLSDSDTIKVIFSEALLPDGNLDFHHVHEQRFICKTGGKALNITPMFTWLAFRYFQVEGKAKINTVCKIHSDISLSSSFESNDPTLNWIYRTYLNTQLCNMHSGIPSDCPHIERRGYTGDGQLTCRSVMLSLDSQSFYRKWIKDISNCQDRISGHVQYTAPYTHSGGGPGGWGSAIVIVPYEYFKIFGDDTPMRELYGQMIKYFDFMESHSENGLVNSDIPGEWCLGEWCTPGPVVLPAPFVNNYFYISAMQKVIEIAKHIGKTDDVPMLEERIDIRKKAILTAYFNKWDGNFIGNLQGANAFALDIGLGDERTKENFIKYYEELGHYDTGIFGTDIVTRLLFSYGRADVAFRLLVANEPFGFGKWKDLGATSFWECWYDARSYSHPMFGSVVAYLFEYILGIKQADDFQGFKKLRISPAAIDALSNVCGHITTPRGKVAVSYKKEDGKMRLGVEIPDGTEAEIVLPSGESKVLSGPACAEF